MHPTRQNPGLASLMLMRSSSPRTRISCLASPSRRSSSSLASVRRGASRNESKSGARAIGQLLGTPQTHRLFELTDEGLLMPWQDASSDRVNGGDGQDARPAEAGSSAQAARNRPPVPRRAELGPSRSMWRRLPGSRRRTGSWDPPCGRPGRDGLVWTATCTSSACSTPARSDVVSIGIPTDDDSRGSSGHVHGWKVRLAGHFESSRVARAAGPVRVRLRRRLGARAWCTRGLSRRKPSLTYPRCLGGARTVPAGGLRRRARLRRTSPSVMADPGRPRARLDDAVGRRPAYDPDGVRPATPSAFDDPRKRWKNAFERK